MSETTRENSLEDINPKHFTIAPYNSSEVLLIPNPPLLRSKLIALIAGGKDNLQVISDFDHTLTRNSVHSERVPVSYELLMNGLLNDEGRQKAFAFENKYTPVEADPSVPLAEKRRLMEEWVRSGNELLVNSGISEGNIINLLTERPLYLRARVEKMFSLCELHNIPVSVVSKGVGNLIEAILPVSENVKVYSNFMEWDETGKIIGFSDPVVDCKRKAGAIINQPMRMNLLVIGDTLEDAAVTEALEYSSCLKVCYFAGKNHENLEDFKGVYDLLVLNDGNMTIIEYILSLVCEEEYEAVNHPSLEEVISLAEGYR